MSAWNYHPTLIFDVGSDRLARNADMGLPLDAAIIADLMYIAAEA